MNATLKVVALLRLVGLSLVASLPPASTAAEPRFDVNDVSFLWPVPTTREEVAKLISADETLADGATRVWSKEAFEAVIDTARSVVVRTSAGTDFGIDFRPFGVEFARPETWKVVALRVDPSAPGCDPKTVAKFGSTPQVRLVMQPVTVSDSGAVKVHDYTAHVVFNLTKQVGPTGAGRAVPDDAAFREVLDDLRALKSASEAAGVPTVGKLGVHPALKAKVPGFAEKVTAFVKRRVSGERLAAAAFMGINPPEPWIFFAASKQPDGTFKLSTFPTIGGKGAQMLGFRGGAPVMPAPITRNVDDDRGVSTAALFEPGIAARLGGPVFAGLDRPRFQDVPDLVANPERANFFNTDCVSCHSESARRVALNISAGDGAFRYVPPAEVSGVDASVLPRDLWNVRNFGWFPRGGSVSLTATMRTANESAESADFINREYFGHSR